MRNFFEHQDRARRNTRTLLLLMILGVLALGLSVYALFVLLQLSSGFVELDAHGRPALLKPGLLAATLAGTALLVGAASGARTLSLREGGRAVAEMLGGRLVSGNPRDELEKRLLNVVEEMAIASGLPVPLVFVLEREQGINAFAAGYTFDDAAIAVTRGTLEALNRDELQGVIAHEFSHVLNGDMRMNLHLMGVVFGVVCIGLLGRLLMRLAHGGSGSRARRGSYTAGLLALGLGLLIVGLVGEFFGKLIKAAISRQREFLADASAVQFTRNPAGIAGALKKIASGAQGSSVRSPRAEEASHFFFADIHARSFFQGLLASHPPLSERIARLDPGAALPPRRAAAPVRAGGPDGARTSGLHAHETPADLGTPDLAHALQRQVGTLSSAAEQEGKLLLESLPASLREASQAPFSACAGVYALLLSDDVTVRAAQRDLLKTRAGEALCGETLRLWPSVRELPRHERLPWVELLAPALRASSPAQRAHFTRTLEALTHCDGQLSVFEYVLTDTLRRRLAPQALPATRARVRHNSLKPLVPGLEVVLSMLAHAGHPDAPSAERAFRAAARAVPELALRLLPREGPILSALGPALDGLNGLAPHLKAQVVRACTEAALSDGELADDEFTLLRVVCDALDCPVPVHLASP